MKRRVLGVVAVLMAGVSAVPVAAQEGVALAQRFGALEAIRSISLSPDGTKIAYVTPHPTVGTAVYIADLTTGAAPVRIIASASKDEQIYWCGWPTAARLVCKVSVDFNLAGRWIKVARAYALNADGSDAKLLTAVNSRQLGLDGSGGNVLDWDVASKPGAVLMSRYFIQEDRAGSLKAEQRQGLGVEEVDTVTLKRRNVEPARGDAREYITDGHGTVRILGTIASNPDGYIREEMSYFYRKQGTREWLPLSKLKLGDTGGVGGFNPYAVDPAKNVVYGFDDHEGRAALFSIALDGTETRQLLLSRNDVDVDGLVRIGRDNRVVGASYATEMRVVDYFDPELKKLAGALSRSLPGKPSIGFVDASSGETKLLMVAASDVDPGRYYLFDKTTRQLGEVLPVRPELAGIKLAPMKPVTYPAADGTQVPGYLTLPPGSSGKGLPAIVMPHGGPGSRDEWGFDWLVQFYAQRGYAVLQPNFRGSTGYGSAWYRKNGFQSWRDAIGDVNDAGRWLVAQGIAAPDKLAIVGWSYGGYAALQSQVLDPSLYKAVVAVAPVTDLERLRAGAVGAYNQTLIQKFIGQGPHIKEGSPAQNPGSFKAPVLMFHGDRDLNVDIGQARFMAERLRGAGKPVELVEFPGLAHSLTDAAARTRLLSESDAFLRKSLGLPAN